MSRRLGVLGAPVLALALIIATATPAGAHGIGGTEPTNYETTLTRVDPAVPGVTVQVIELGNKLQLTNRSGHDVVVLGYDGERYLRVGPRGVFENRNSPATYLNRSRVPTDAPPRSADATAPVRWRKVSDGQVASWHDHRAHFMGTEAPPVVRDDPGRRHVLDRWTVELRSRGRTVVAHGVLAWVPPPSPWPYVGIALALAVLVIGLARTRWWHGVLVAGLIALVVCAAAHAVGIWADSDAGFGTKLGESVYSIVGIGLGVVALGWIVRRGVESSVPFVLVASVFLLVAGGLADVSTIGHSQVPSSLPPTVARVAVALTIGLGVGLTVAAGWRLRVLVPPPGERSVSGSVGGSTTTS
jgi:hypothetical protein